MSEKSISVIKIRSDRSTKFTNKALRFIYLNIEFGMSISQPELSNKTKLLTEETKYWNKQNIECMLILVYHKDFG